MSVQDKLSKGPKILRLKAQEFLLSRKNANNLVDVVRHFESGADTTACLLTLEVIFTTLLQEQEMFIEIIPLKPLVKTPEIQYREWLQTVYNECFKNILTCFEGTPTKIQVQSLSTAMNLIIHESKYPLESKNNLDNHVPLMKLKLLIAKLLSCKQVISHLIVKLQEYFIYDDIVFMTWKILPTITAKSNPIDIYIVNYLLLLEKLPLEKNAELKICDSEGVSSQFDELVARKCLNKIWNCIMLWDHTPATHKQLLFILLEKVLPYLDRPLLLTDFLMDSLDVSGPVSLLALQGIFTLIQQHNLEYPNIFAKLYSMFEPEIFHTKFKARLFYLSDMFLSSTHLPEGLVAAFAKRLARLALVAPSEDIIVICMFIGNLIIRHPGLKILLNHPSSGCIAADPYIMEEGDPLKSNAINSSLWEIQTLQSHVLPSVATAARFINSALPSVEWDFTKILDNTGDDIFEKEIKKNTKMVILAFDRPRGCAISKGEKISLYWNL